MIFKTFDSNIDKWTAKIGVLGKSFNDFIEASNNRKIVIDDLFTINGVSLKDAKKQAGSFWSYLYPKKEDIKNQLVDVMPEINTTNVSDAIEKIKVMASAVSEGKTSWQNLFDTLPEGEKHFAQLGQQMEDQIITEEGVIKANQEARASALAHNEAIKAQTLSAKASKVALQALATVGNILAGFIITKALQAAVTAFDNYIHRVEKANEAMQDAVNEYESAKSSLESINSELEEQNKKIDDLLAKDKLTYVEKGQLEELQEITKELLLQQDIEERRAETASKEAANKAVDAYNKQYGKYDKAKEDLQEKLSYENFYLPEDEDDVLGNITAYVKATELLSESQKKYQNALKNGEDTSWLADEVQYDIDFVNDLSQALDDNLSDLQEKRLALEEEYNNAIEKRQKGIEPLTSSEQDIISTYESIYDVMKMVYEYTNQNTWNNMEIENIFNAEGIEKTKEELAEMAKSGELTPETIASYKNLNDAIQDSEIFLKNGQTAAEAFCEQMNALNATLDYAEVERQFRQSLGIRDGEINGASDQKIWNEIKDSFSDDEWQIALEAYLKVRDQYGEHPEGWNAKDWLSHIQSELETEVIEIRTQLSISETVDQLNTRLKPAFDSLKSAYQDIFTDDGFALNSIDILSTCDSIKSKLDEMSELGLSIDYSSYEDFVRVLRDSESTEQNVEDAFDSLASSITQAALSGAEDFETMKAALEDLGVVNSEMVAFDALARNTEMLDEALSQANISMDDFIVNAEDGTVQATKEGQAFLEEKVGAENCAEALSILVFQKELCNLQEMNTAGEVANLKTLAENAGYTGEVIQYLTELEQIYQEVASGTLTPMQIGFKVARAAMLKALIDNAANKVNYEPNVDWSSAVKSAGKAGKDAGKSFKDELKEQLSDIEGVISGVTKAIDRQISSINEQKSAALDSIDAQIDALEEAKDAAVEALEAERDAQLEIIESQKKALEKQIKAKQDEIDAINEAANARAREISLQKAQYELEKMQNMRTKLVKNKMPYIIVI